MRHPALAILLAVAANEPLLALAQQPAPRPSREPDIKLHCVGQNDAVPFSIWLRERTCGFLGNPTAHPCSISETEFRFDLYSREGKWAVSYVIDRIQGSMTLRHEGASHSYKCQPITPGTKKF